MPASKTPHRTKRSSSAAASKARSARASKTTKKKGTKSRRPLLHPLHISVTAVLLIVAGAIFTFTSLGRSGTSDAATCTVDAKLVNSCRPWLSAAVGGYPQTGGGSGSVEQFEFHNKRLNNANVLNSPSAATTITHKIDMPHVYHSPGQNLFNSAAKAVLANTSIYNDPSKPILINWKPGGASWAATARGDNDASIRTAAQQVKALGTRKIMLTLWHEPENDNVNSNGLNITGACKKPVGANGSAADYRGVWKRTRQIFDQEGVTNVVWAWNPMGYVGSDGKSGWACIEDALYPGDELVDWVIWDPYSDSGGDGSFYNSVNRFYKYMTDRDGNTNYGFKHSYTSKPWGIAEHGSNSARDQVIAYYRDGIKTLGNSWSENKFPRIKMYSVFDTSVNGGDGGGLRVGYNNQGQIDAQEQAAYNEFAKHILSYNGGSSTPTPTTDKTPPVVTITAPQDGSRQSGTITVKGTATDNVKVTAVTLRVDDKWIETDGSAPYEFKLDTRKLKEGRHSITLRAWDAKDNMGVSQSVTITVDNNRSSADDTAFSPVITTYTMDATTPTTSESPLKVKGTIIVNPVTSGNAVEVWLNDKQLANNVIETSKLQNGTYVIRIIENGETAYKHVSVNNPLPLAAANHVRANAIAYSISAFALVVIVVAWFGRSYVFALINRR